MTRATGHQLRLIAYGLIGPLALLSNLLVGFALVPWVCANHWEAALRGVNFVFLLIAAGAGWLGWLDWRRSGTEWPGEDAALESRSRFLAVVAVVLCALSSLQIAGTIMTTFLLGACQ